MHLFSCVMHHHAFPNMLVCVWVGMCVGVGASSPNIGKDHFKKILVDCLRCLMWHQRGSQYYSGNKLSNIKGLCKRGGLQPLAEHRLVARKGLKA